VNSLDIIRMIIPPGPAHTSRVDMVRHDVAVIRERGTADAPFTALGNDFSVEKLPHLSIGAKLAIPSRMEWIFDSAYTELSNCLRFRNYFPSAAKTRTMDGATSRE
jgi:hypothetical protein